MVAPRNTVTHQSKCAYTSILTGFEHIIWCLQCGEGGERSVYLLPIKPASAQQLIGSYY